MSPHFILFLVLLMFGGLAMADGPVKQVGDTLTYTCNAPTTYADGTPLPAGTPFTITIYVTQNLDDLGEAVATGSGCPLSSDSSGMAAGQWYAQALASAEGRSDSTLSNAAPFVLVPGATVPLSAPTDLQVQ